MRRPAGAALAVYRAGEDPVPSRPEATLGSGPSGELAAGQRAFALLRNGLFWQLFSPTKAL